jgi:hypothetical protein
MSSEVFMTRNKLFLILFNATMCVACAGENGETPQREGQEEVTSTTQSSRHGGVDAPLLGMRGEAEKAKIRETLDAVRGMPDGTRVDLLVELFDPKPFDWSRLVGLDDDERSTVLDERKADLSPVADPVAAKVEELGGEVIELNWGDEPSLRVHIESDEVESLSELGEVRSLRVVEPPNGGSA